MRYDIYYLIEKWANNLYENNVCKNMVKELIPNELTYEVTEIDTKHHVIDLKEKEGNNCTIKRVLAVPNQKNEKVKLEYLGEIGNLSTFETISAKENKKEGIYSHITIINDENYHVFLASTFIVDQDMKIKKITVENNCYDVNSNTLKIIDKEIYNTLGIVDYCEALRKIKHQEREENYSIPDLELSVNINIDNKNNIYNINMEGDLQTDDNKENIIGTLESPIYLNSCVSEEYLHLNFSKKLGNELKRYNTNIINNYITTIASFNTKQEELKNIGKKMMQQYTLNNLIDSSHVIYDVKTLRKE